MYPFDLENMFDFLYLVFRLHLSTMSCLYRAIDIITTVLMGFFFLNNYELENIYNVKTHIQIYHSHTSIPLIFSSQQILWEGRSGNNQTNTHG